MLTNKKKISRSHFGEFLMQVFFIIIFCFFCSGFVVADEIHDAVKRGDLEKVKSLLSSDRNLLNAPDIIGHTPLSLSAAYARWDVFRYLLDKGADANIITRTSSTPMHCACYYDRPDMVRLLFQHGGVPCLKVRDVYGEYTPMLRAVQRGCKDVVALLFENGANPDDATKEGWNALHLAAKCGHRHLYGLLIEKGVSLDANDLEGKRPMEYDFRRPDPIPIEPELLNDYIGRYTWEGAPEGLGIEVFIKADRLILDDYSLNELYPIGEDIFYCSQDPWTIKFHRDIYSVIDRVELFFLRRSVMLNKMQ